MAVLPLLPLVLAVISPLAYSPKPGWDWWSWVAVGVANIALATADAKRLKAAGIAVQAGWVLAFVLGYIIARTRAAKSAVLIPIAWGVCFLVAVIGSATFAAVYSYTGSSIAPGIARQASAQFGDRIHVTCPDMVGHSGDVFTCRASDKSGSANLLVTLGRNQYYWQLQPSS
jgi:hypothetical protein